MFQRVSFRDLHANYGMGNYGVGHSNIGCFGGDFFLIINGSLCQHVHPKSSFYIRRSANNILFIKYFQ